MKLISIKSDLIRRFAKADHEVLLKEGRPVVLVVKLKYRGKNMDFAVPIRSNIAPHTSPDEYFALPNRPSTKPKHHHGLHLIKMFPVDKPYYERYRTTGDVASTLYLAIIDKHENEIVTKCQKYLDDYETGKRYPYCTDLDTLISELGKMTK